LPAYRCSDVGLSCPYVTDASSVEELMKKIREHAKKAHGLKKIAPEMEGKINKAIRR
jgi:predicted small metal-binding protein